MATCLLPLMPVLPPLPVLAMLVVVESGSTLLLDVGVG